MGEPSDKNRATPHPEATGRGVVKNPGETNTAERTWQHALDTRDLFCHLSRERQLWQAAPRTTHPPAILRDCGVLLPNPKARRNLPQRVSLDPKKPCKRSYITRCPDRTGFGEGLQENDHLPYALQKIPCARNLGRDPPESAPQRGLTTQIFVATPPKGRTWVCKGSRPFAGGLGARPPGLLKISVTLSPRIQEDFAPQSKSKAEPPAKGLA